MKRSFEIEWPDENGPLWMNSGNLLICLTEICSRTRFTVRDITGDDVADPSPYSSGPRLRDDEPERPSGWYSYQMGKTFN